MANTKKILNKNAETKLLKFLHRQKIKQKMSKYAGTLIKSNTAT